MRGPILVVSPWSSLWSLAPGAGVADEAHMLSGLVAHGYDVHVLVPRAPKLLPASPGLSIHTMANVLALPAWLPAPLRRLWLLPAFWSVAGRAATRWARQLRPRLVLGFSHYGAYPAARAGAAVGAPSLLKLFGVMQAMHLEWPLPRYLYHNVEAVLAFRQPLTHFLLLNDGTQGDRVARRWGVAEKRFTWLPNGVDKDWAQLPLERERLRQEHGVAPGTCVLLSLARLVDSKRVDRIVEAVGDAAPLARTPLLLWIAGDGPLRSRLERQCRARRIAHSFLGSVPRSQVPHVLGAADVLVAASTLTNMSIPTCEAMVVGTPVIALDVAGTAEVVQDMQNGLLVPEGDPAALARAIARLADDAALRQRLGSAARDFAARRFMSWDARVAAEIALIDRLVAAAPVAGGNP